MSRVAFVDPQNGAVRQQQIIAGVTTARGICFDGVGFWVIDETSATTWDIVYCCYVGGVFAATYRWPFLVVLAGTETLVLVHGITTDDLDLYIAYRIQVTDPGPPISTTAFEYLSKWNKDGGNIFEKQLGISGLVSRYNDLTWDGLSVFAAVGGSSQVIRQIDPLSLKTTDVNCGFVPVNIAYNGLDYYMQSSAAQLRIVNRNGVTGPLVSLTSASGGLCYGNPTFDKTSISDFMNGEWVAALYP